MLFSRSLLVTLLSAPFLAFAQSSGNGPNAFIIPTSGLTATAGQALTLKWSPTTEGTVSLILRSGSSSDLAEGQTIASHITNSGSYTWTPALNTVRGSDYTVEIISDTDPTAVNYTPYFVLDSDNTVAPSSTSLVTEGAPSSSLSLSTAPYTASPSAFPSNSAMTSSSGSMTTSGSMSQSTSASPSSTSSNPDLQAQGSSSSSGSGARATAVVGMLGAVALGALAL